MKQLFAIFLILLCLTVRSQDVDAAGTAGLTYEFYRGTGPQPSLTPLAYPTVIKTGVSPTVNYSGAWGGTSTVLDTGYWDRFIVRWYGYINVPTTGTYTFGASADDGVIVRIDNTEIISGWYDSGGALRTSTPVTLTAGTPVPIEIWYYENGGGQAITFWYLNNNTWTVTPTTMLATDSTYWAPAAPTLCCGGSGAAFSANSTNVANVMGFTNRVIKDSQVYIDQIGDNNTITVTQQGTKDNKVAYQGNGSNNTVTINQTGNNSTTTNYIDLKITGDSNTANLTQTSTGGGKGIFATINNNNNSLIVQQKDSGSHYAEINLSGGNKNVDVLQQGIGNHMVKIDLSGNPTNLNLSQSGSTQQFYSIQHTCATAGGCAAITVTQGQ
jgi:hypothetical protein